MSSAELDVVMRKHEALRNELTRSRELLSGAGLVFPDETTLIRLDGDEIVVQHRPFSGESIEHLTAYYVVDCETADRAERIAERMLDHHVTAVEVRRIHDSLGM